MVPPEPCGLACQVWQYLDSNFSAALFGALFGAIGAHVIATRAGRHKDILEEIRSANAAIVLSFTLFSICASLKKQHVRELKETFHARRQEVLDHHKGREEGRIPKDQYIQVPTDFKHLSPPTAPVDSVKQLVFENLSVTHRPLMLVAMLAQTLDALKSVIDLRNTVIDECRHGQVPPQFVPHIYFGLPMKGGHVDARYSDSVGAIASYTDDCIFFAYLLCQDLERHAKRLAASLGDKAPKVNRIDFAKPKEEGLIPDEKLYADWVNMAKEPPDDYAHLL